MKKTHIKENGFEGGVGGSNGTVNYQTGYGTPTSPDNSQNSNQFASSTNNKAINQNDGDRKDGAAKSGSMSNNIDAIYAKPQTPNPDEFISGIKYEMGQQNKKDKEKAKEIALANLAKDPKFYSSLKMLGIDDATMMDNVTELKHPNDAPRKSTVKPKTEETKKIFMELATNRDNKYAVNSGISAVMKQMWEAKQKRNDWREGK